MNDAQWKKYNETRHLVFLKSSEAEEQCRRAGWSAIIRNWDECISELVRARAAIEIALIKCEEMKDL